MVNEKIAEDKVSFGQSLWVILNDSCYISHVTWMTHLIILQLLTKETNAAEAQLLKLNLKLKKLQQKNSKYESLLDNRIATFENRLHKKMIAYNSVLGKALTLWYQPDIPLRDRENDFSIPDGCEMPFESSKC